MRILVYGERTKIDVITALFENFLPSAEVMPMRYLDDIIAIAPLGSRDIKIAFIDWSYTDAEKVYCHIHEKCLIPSALLVSNGLNWQHLFGLNICGYLDWHGNINLKKFFR